MSPLSNWRESFVGQGEHYKGSSAERKAAFEKIMKAEEKK